MSAQSPYSRLMCPIGGRCGDDCGRTSETCVAIFGPDAEHAEALRINADLDAADRLLRVCADLEITFQRWLPGDPQPACDCPLDPHHRWNCALTPIWAQTIRDLDVNPWGRWSSHDVPVCRSFGCGSPLGHLGDHDTGSLAEQIARQNAKNADARKEWDE